MKQIEFQSHPHLYTNYNGSDLEYVAFLCTGTYRGNCRVLVVKQYTLGFANNKLILLMIFVENEFPGKFENALVGNWSSADRAGGKTSV